MLHENMTATIATAGGERIHVHVYFLYSGRLGGIAEVTAYILGISPQL